MILRRFPQSAYQNWTAITIEFVLVVLGVFFGILAANWNVERVEKQETGDCCHSLIPSWRSS